MLLSRRLVNETNRRGGFLNGLILGPNPLSSAAHRPPYLLAGVPVRSVGPRFLGADALSGAGGRRRRCPGGSSNRPRGGRLLLGAGAWPLSAATLISQSLWSLHSSVTSSLFPQQQEERMGSRGLATPAVRSGPVPSSERGVTAAGGCVTQARSAVSLLSFRLKYLLRGQEKCQKQHHV